MKETQKKPANSNMQVFPEIEINLFFAISLFRYLSRTIFLVSVKLPAVI